MPWSLSTNPDDHNSHVSSMVRTGDSVLRAAPGKDSAMSKDTRAISENTHSADLATSRPFQTPPCG